MENKTTYMFMRAWLLLNDWWSMRYEEGVASHRLTKHIEKYNKNHQTHRVYMTTTADKKAKYNFGRNEIIAETI